MVTVLLFASLRDLAGQGEIELEIESPTTVASLFDDLKTLFPKLAAYRSSLLIAVNEEYAHWKSSVEDGDEVAFFPPVSGGAP